MDLIYTNSSRVDQGVLLDYELDLAFGADENNLECRVQAGSHCCESGSLLYMEGTEYGGIVDSIESDTDSKEVIYTGRTWHGILNSKVLQPDSGAAYLTLTGEANAVIASLLTRMGLEDLFESSSENSGLTISSYKMNRYISGYDGILKMLKTVGGKLKLIFSGGKIVLSAAAVHDYTQDEEFDADQVPFRAKRNYKGVNHLICLGSGQLEERMVVHLYADTNGNISQTQTQFGLDEICTIFEYSNIEKEEELIKEGKEKFESLMAEDEISIDFDSDSDAYDVGDIIGAVDNITGLSAYTTIAKKIVTIKNGKITISLSPDTAKAGSSKEIGGGNGGNGGISGGVESFNGREGAVVPAVGDYTAAMVGAAPGGFGLGEGSILISDCNTAVLNGFYRWESNCANAPFSYGVMQTIARAKNTHCIQIAYRHGGGSIEISVRKSINSLADFEPWEYVNPPMVQNTEYRTTERFNGKVVYTKLVAIAGSLTTIGSAYYHPYSNESCQPFFVSGFMGYFGTSLPYDGVAKVYGNGKNIVIIAERDLSLATVYVQVKYTK